MKLNNFIVRVPEQKLQGQKRRNGAATLEVCNHNLDKPRVLPVRQCGVKTQISLQRTDLPSENMTQEQVS